MNNNRCVVCGAIIPEGNQVCVSCERDANNKGSETLNQLQEDNKVLKQLINGEWVDCDAVQRALGIDFGTGLKRFEFSRTAEWNPAPLNGQKITTKFRLKMSKVSEKHIPKVPKYIDGDYDLPLCPSCGLSVDEDKDAYCSICGQALDWSEFE